MYRLFLLIAIAPACCASAASPTKVELSEPLPPSPVLGTTHYVPTETEKAASKDWTKVERDSGSPETASLRGAVGRRTCWFGVVRDIKEDKAKDETTLLLEMKYFDGLTDLHLHVVSIYGAGDFRAVLHGTGLKIKRLALLRVYGKVVKQEGDVPELAADYVRLWNWGLFTFMDYGQDKSNKKWIALRKTKPEECYSSSPDDDYYEQILGKP